MKAHTLIALSLFVSTFSALTFAHDPSQHHQHDATTADCSKMKDMDMSKMDSNDPVMKAMQKKCKAQMEHEAMEHEHEGAKTSASSSQSSTHKHDAATVDCSKMKDMDMSKMDMNDPAMKAMHDKCMQKMNHDDMKSMSHDNQKSSSSSAK